MGVVTVPQWLRIVGVVFLVFIIYAIFRSPDESADLIVGGIEGIAAGVGAVFSFFDSILGSLGDSALALGTAPPLDVL